MNKFNPLDGSKELEVKKPTVRNCRAIYSVMSRTTSLPKSERIRFARMSGQAPSSVELVEDETSLTAIVDLALRLPQMPEDEQKSAIEEIEKLSAEKKEVPRYLLDDDYDDESYIPALCKVLFDEFPAEFDALDIDLGEVHRALAFFEKKRSGLL